MSKKIISFFIGIIFFSGFNLALADVIFNEIAWKGMPTASTHEWLELFNTGAGPEDISSWTIKDGIDQLNILIPPETIIPAGGFYVIKRTTSTITPFNLSVPFNGGLSDTGEKLILADATGTMKKTLDFSAGWPDAVMTSENTMQWNSLSWVTATPTPGIANETLSTPPTPPAPSSSSSSSSSSSGNAIGNKIEAPKIKVQITAKALAFSGIPLSFEGMALGYSGEQLRYGKYFWNFGDGDFLEVKTSDSQKFTHTYFFAGEYVVSLEYYLNYYGDVPDASDKITIKVVPADILISGVGDEKDFFVELSNNTNYDVDISNWILISDARSFSFPRNTIIEAKKKIIISSKLTNFSIEDKSTLKLMTPQGDIAFDYQSSLLPTKTVLTLPTENIASNIVRVKSSKDKEIAPIQPSPEEANSNEINALQNLSASPSLSDVVREDTDNSYIPIIIFFALLATSAGAVYFLRQKKIVPSVGSDFEILDE